MYKAEFYIVLIVLLVIIINKIHIWRMRKNYKNLIKNIEANPDKFDTKQFVDILYKFNEIKEVNNSDYVLLVIQKILGGFG